MLWKLQPTGGQINTTTALSILNNGLTDVNFVTYCTIVFCFLLCVFWDSFRRHWFWKIIPTMLQYGNCVEGSVWCVDHSFLRTFSVFVYSPVADCIFLHVTKIALNISTAVCVVLSAPEYEMQTALESCYNKKKRVYRGTSGVIKWERVGKKIESNEVPGTAC